MCGSLFILSKFTPKAEHYDDAFNALKDFVVPTLDEPGCRALEIYEGDDERCFYLMQEWSGDPALREHFKASHTRALMAKYAEWLDTPMQATRMKRPA